ncbi:DNA-3-methyladenine glycosylase I [Lentilactobacillus sp. SPB1-3]|uniref:DNA-3-methyladenine glycosylase I n=1 Tax=Lentilactobacillus terminaliae TaxID=3003483 RepID=A0ACD5DD17_9LACO|nr:DNA-3-methyladenine glycosylase I [Lentilactobacillus sp. SPB1-3]MCZ0977404.1 DNA-3-methyladenine glycosylase I [Lentilactobacillus sp. SPB1-3]
MTTRCEWANKSPELMYYHDCRWGKPVYDFNGLFHALVLEIFQAGLSFQTVLKFELGLKSAFANFNPQDVANYSEEKWNDLYNDKNIIRNHAKIDAVLHNAMVISADVDRFIEIVWGNTNDMPIDHRLSHDLGQDEMRFFVDKYVQQFKQMGLKRMGPVTTYSFLQAVGVVNDHILDCAFRK